MKKLLFITVALMSAYSMRAQWEPDVRLTNNSAASDLGENSLNELVIKGDTLHIVWYDMRDGNPEIYYKRSTDGGTTWGPDIRLTNNSGLSYDPSLAVSGGVVHVVWEDSRNGINNREIYYKRSEDGGTTWGSDIRLTNANLASESPSIAISGSVVHVAWYDERNDPTGNWYTDIYYKRSIDGGLTWGPDLRLTNKPNAYSGFPAIAVFDSIVHIVWEDERNGNGDVYYKRSTDGGITWGSDVQLTSDPADQYDPCIAVSDSVLHVVWHDSRNGNTNDEIYYKRSTDGGVTWGPDIRLTNASGYSDYPTVAVSGSLVHVVWHDNRNIVYQIYYKESTDGGLSWGPDTRLTDVPFDSQDPFIALYDSTVHVIWNDNRDGNWEIYYKRNPTGNILVGIGNEPSDGPDQHYTIYPNPASNVFQIRCDNFFNEKLTLFIRNIPGEELLSKQIQNGESMIDVSKLKNGFYFLTVETNKNQVMNTKLIIAK